MAPASEAIAFSGSPDASPVLNVPFDERMGLVAASVICVVATYTFLALRMWARRRVDGWKADDWTAILGVALSTCYVISVNFSLKVHSSAAAAAEAASIFYALAVLMLKLSILLLFRRSFGKFDVSKISAAVGGVMVLYTIANVLVLVLGCTSKSGAKPIQGFRDDCVNFHAAQLSISVLDIGTAIFMLVLPVPSLVQLRASASSAAIKTAIGAMALGFFAFVMTVLRTTAMAISLPVLALPISSLLVLTLLHVAGVLPTLTAKPQENRPVSPRATHPHRESNVRGGNRRSSWIASIPILLRLRNSRGTSGEPGCGWLSSWPGMNHRNESTDTADYFAEKKVTRALSPNPGRYMEEQGGGSASYNNIFIIDDDNADSHSARAPTVVDEGFYSAESTPNTTMNSTTSKKFASLPAGVFNPQGGAAAIASAQAANAANASQLTVSTSHSPTRSHARRPSQASVQFPNDSSARLYTHDESSRSDTSIWRIGQTVGSFVVRPRGRSSSRARRGSSSNNNSNSHHLRENSIHITTEMQQEVQERKPGAWQKELELRRQREAREEAERRRKQERRRKIEARKKQEAESKEAAAEEAKRLEAMTEEERQAEAERKQKEAEIARAAAAACAERAPSVTDDSGDDSGAGNDKDLEKGDVSVEEKEVTVAAAVQQPQVVDLAALRGDEQVEKEVAVEVPGVSGRDVGCGVKVDADERESRARSRSLHELE